MNFIKEFLCKRRDILSKSFPTLTDKDISIENNKLKYHGMDIIISEEYEVPFLTESQLEEYLKSSNLGVVKDSSSRK